jgi:hypothetical protein
MIAHQILDAVEAASRVRDAHTPRALAHAVGDFIRLIGEVPDESGPGLSADDARLIQSLGDDVIDRIEKHVSESPFPAQAQSLVSAVYEIRRLLEEVDHARQHYAIARSV